MDIKKWKFRLGIILITVSVIIFLMLFVLPFISMETKFKIAFSTVLIIAGEGMFWIGVILIGKEVYIKFKEKLKSGEWLEKKKKDENDTQL